MTSFARGVKAGAITKDMILQQEEEALEKYDTMSDSIVSQMAILYVQDEYKAMDYDTDQIQTHYLWVNRGKDVRTVHFNGKRQQSVQDIFPLRPEPRSVWTYEPGSLEKY